MLVEQNIIEQNILQDDFNDVIDIIMDGNLDKLKPYYDYILSADEELFCDILWASCHSGKLSIVEWLFGIRNSNPNPIPQLTIESAFDGCCIDPCFGKLSVAKWLYETKLFKMKISTFINPDHNYEVYNNENFYTKKFIRACYFGNLSVAKWLLKTRNDINISELDNLKIDLLCEWNCVKIIEWLLQIKPDIATKEKLENFLLEHSANKINCNEFELEMIEL